MTSKSIRETRQLAFDYLITASVVESNLNEGEYAIDTDFPEEFADTLSRLEAYNKHLFRPNTYLHKWWARRCGSTFRTILKQFIADPNRRDYYAPKGLEGKIILDPMMGGGTTLHEAIRLGANVIGADIDPIPVVQARASLSPLTIRDLRAAFYIFFEELYSQIGQFFLTECPHCAKEVDSQYTLYGSRKKCSCEEVVQIDQFDLRHEANRTIRIWPNTWIISDKEIEPDGPSKPIRLITRDEKTCRECSQKYQELLDIPYYQRYTPVAIAAVCPEHGFFFRRPNESDLDKIKQADELRASLEFGEIENFTIQNGPKSGDLLKRKLSSYLDLFTSRQLLYLHRAISLLKKYQGPIRLNLALLVSTSLEFNALLCGYKGWARNRPGAIKHVFSHHAYLFPYTAAENNPVNSQRSSGNLQSLFKDRLERGRRWALAPVERKIDQNGKVYLFKIHGEFDGGTEVADQNELKAGNQKHLLIQGNSSHIPVNDESVDFVVTDPPYYDSVQYSDLAAFFRVWLACLLPDEIDWNYDETQSAVATKSNGLDKQYVTMLSGIFKECGRVLKKDSGRMVFTFHHWDPNAWADLTIALKTADFRLVNTYVLFSENPISIHIQNLNAIKHDSILVLTRDEKNAGRAWTEFERIDTSDSETFCRQCAMSLGWLLESNHQPEQIRKIWKHLIQGRN
ncbi:MAG: DNA methyltransferase [Anaerolineales bacterium]|nr:DNA methyltransferase [Anaerolineales bacterium]